VLGQGLDIIFGVVVLVAVVAMLVGAVAFGRGAVRVAEGWLGGHAHETDTGYERGAAERAEAAQAAMRSMALRRLAASRAATLYDSASVG
jgi:hypothetical protein